MIGPANCDLAWQAYGRLEGLHTAEPTRDGRNRSAGCGETPLCEDADTLTYGIVRTAVEAESHGLAAQHVPPWRMHVFRNTVAETEIARTGVQEACRAPCERDLVRETTLYAW